MVPLEAIPDEDTVCPDYQFDFKPRLSRQSSKDSIRSTQTSHRSKSQSRADEAGDEEDEDSMVPFKSSTEDHNTRERGHYMPKLNIITKTSIFAKEKQMQAFAAIAIEKDPVAQVPVSAGNIGHEGARLLRRSQTPNIMLSVDSPTYPAARRSAARRAETRIDSKRKGSEDNLTLNTLREKLGRIKVLQALIKGYDVLISYANTIDNFNEFSSGKVYCGFVYNGICRSKNSL